MTTEERITQAAKALPPELRPRLCEILAAAALFGTNARGAGDYKTDALLGEITRAFVHMPHLLVGAIEAYAINRQHYLDACGLGESNDLGTDLREPPQT